MKGAWLEDLTWPEAAAWFKRDAVMLVPIGAASKEHGPHLPLCTDYLLARGICDGVLARVPVLAAPVIPFGYYPAFRHYPGSQHLSPATFTAVLHDILGGFIQQGLKNIVVVNTGISTEPVLTVVLREIYEETGIRISAANISALGTSTDGIFAQALGGHGDEHETSIILAMDAARVRVERAMQDYGNASDAAKTVFYRPTIFSGAPGSGPDYSKTGVRGDPTLASVDKGRLALAAIVDDIIDGLERIYPDALGSPP